MRRDEALDVDAGIEMELWVFEPRCRYHFCAWDAPSYCLAHLGSTHTCSRTPLVATVAHSGRLFQTTDSF